MPSSTYDLLRDAILNRRQVTCEYQGYHREMCPHVLGIKNGVEHVLSYQFAGTGSHGLKPGGQWRCMDVDQIVNAASHAGQWHTGTSHTQPQTCVDDIDVQVPII
jgi:predicted DNA-binding transcriptional regulator YafY